MKNNLRDFDVIKNIVDIVKLENFKNEQKKKFRIEEEKKAKLKKELELAKKKAE